MTHESFNSSNSVHAIDHVLVNSNNNVLVKQYTVSAKNMVHSDHNYLETTSKLMLNKKAKKN